MRKFNGKNNKKLSIEQLNELKYNATGILAEARKTMLNRFPFVGSIAMSLDLIPVRDSRIATMATDGKAIYCDIDFLSTLSNDDKVFILAHEVYHNVMLHSLRKENRDHVAFNYATDMEVNAILEADGLSVPKDAIMPRTYGFPTGLSAEEYYDLLIACNINNSNNDIAKSSGTNSSGNDDGQLTGQFDKHIYKGEEVEEASSKGYSDKYGEIDDTADPDFQPNVTQSAVEQVREAAVAAAQMIERQCGELPGHLQKIVKGLLEPKLDWKEVLQKFVLKTAGESERTWNRPNRRFAGRGLYLPSSQCDSIKIAVGIDTSGSIEQYCDQFLSELNGIISSFGDYEVTAIQCDTSVKKVEKFDNIDHPLDCAEFKFYGFGGTRLQPIFDRVKDDELDVSCIVVITDGEVSDDFRPENAPDVPVLWCVTKNGRKDKLKFGEICDLDV